MENKPDFESMLKKNAFKIHPLDTEKAAVSIDHADWCLEHVWNTHVVPLQDENERLKTTLIAGAELIKENWEKLCDEEGYGPQNLLLRMDGTLNTSGYPGYSSGAFERLESENKALRDWKDEHIKILDGQGYKTEIERLESDNKALREELLTTEKALQEINNQHQEDYKRLKSALEEIERLKAEVLKEKFPGN